MSSLLYQRRFFPYYTFNMVVGLDDAGKGVCYSYDVVGSTEPFEYGTRGTASSFVEPLLDCLMRKEHMVGQAPAAMSRAETVETLKNAFTSAAERDIYTGDSVKFFVITKDGVDTEIFPLRKD
ncbi:20S proteasome subunit beta 6 [Strigomonas culicis]|nr:20S proteasome subunit beta 6 [Strigomonas culicis]|eukprot:EPY35928.1 20S proteasome subunit beta 6 [Strigomonas culicis]